MGPADLRLVDRRPDWRRDWPALRGVEGGNARPDARVRLQAGEGRDHLQRHLPGADRYGNDPRQSARASGSAARRTAGPPRGSRRGGGDASLERFHHRPEHPGQWRPLPDLTQRQERHRQKTRCLCAVVRAEYPVAPTGLFAAGLKRGTRMIKTPLVIASALALAGCGGQQFRSSSSSTGPVGAYAIQEYPVPDYPHDVAPAPDGSIWWTAQTAGYLGQLDPKSGETHPIPLGPGSRPHGVI